MTTSTEAIVLKRLTQKKESLIMSTPIIATGTAQLKQARAVAIFNECMAKVPPTPRNKIVERFQKELNWPKHQAVNMIHQIKSGS